MRAVGQQAPEPPAQAQMQRVTGALGEARVWRNKSGAVRAQVTCLLKCKGGGHGWRSASDGASPGQGSSIEFALDLWANHLDSKHREVCPWSTAPQRGEALRRHKEAESQFWADLGLAPPVRP